MCVCVCIYMCVCVYIYSCIYVYMNIDDILTEFIERLRIGRVVFDVFNPFCGHLYIGGPTHANGIIYTYTYKTIYICIYIPIYIYIYICIHINVYTM